MTTYIMIGDDAYVTDTDEQIEEARAAMRDAGLDSVAVYAGDPDGLDDSYKNGCVLFAVPNTISFLKDEEKES